MSGSKYIGVMGGLLVAVCAFGVSESAVFAQQKPVVEAGSASARGLTLSEVLTLTEANNEEWELSELAIRRSQAMRREALAGLLPQLNLSAGVTRQAESSVGGNVVRKGFDWNTGLTASVMLFDGARYPSYSRAGDMVDVSKAEASWRRHTLLMEAEQSFYVLASAQREVAIAQKTVELRQAYLERAEAMLAADLAIGLDTARARTDLLEAQQRVLEAQISVGNASDALAILIGSKPDALLEAELTDFVMESPPGSAETSRLMERADFVSQKYALKAAERGKSAVWWSFLPRVELRAGLSQGPTTLFNPTGSAWSLSLAANWLLYDGGTRYARLELADVEIRERELGIERSLRTASAQLSNALRDWQLTAAALSVAEEQVKSAQEAYDVAEARFQAGLATSIEVTDASQALFRAEMALNQTELRAMLTTSRYRYLEAIESP